MVTMTTSKKEALRKHNISDFNISLDWYNNWKLNPTSELQITPKLKRIFYLENLEGNVDKYSLLPNANVEDGETYSVNTSEDINGVIFQQGNYYFDASTNKWEYTDSSYSIFKITKMFNTIAEAALIDFLGVAEPLIYLDPKNKEHLTASQFAYAQDAIGYQIYHIINNGQEENESDFSMSAGIDVQQGDNTKQLVWEGLHSKVTSIIDLAKLNEIEIEFDGDGNVVAIAPINITIYGIKNTVADLPKNPRINDAWWVDKKIYVFNGSNWVASPELIGRTGPKGDPGSDAPAMFDVVDDGGKEVLQPKAGRDVQIVDDSGQPIVPTSPHSVITHQEVDNKLAVQKQYIDEADTNIQKNIDDTKQVADEAFIIAKKNETDIDRLENNITAIETASTSHIYYNSDFANGIPVEPDGTGTMGHIALPALSPWPTSGEKGLLDLSFMDGNTEIHFELPFKFHGTVIEHFDKGTESANLNIVWTANRTINIDAKKAGFFGPGVKLVGIRGTSSLVDLSQYEKRSVADAKNAALYEKKNNEYKLTGFTKNNTDGSDYVLTTKPVGFDNLPIGAVVLLDMTEASTLAADPAQLPPDASKVFLGTDIAIRITAGAGTVSLKWGDKTNPTDPNLKDNYATKKLKGIIEEVIVDINGTPTKFKQIRFIEWVELKTSGGGSWVPYDKNKHNFLTVKNVRFYSTIEGGPPTKYNYQKIFSSTKVQFQFYNAPTGQMKTWVYDSSVEERKINEIINVSNNWGQSIPNILDFGILDYLEVIE